MRPTLQRNCLKAFAMSAGVLAGLPAAHAAGALDVVAVKASVDKGLDGFYPISTPSIKTFTPILNWDSRKPRRRRNLLAKCARSAMR